MRYLLLPVLTGLGACASIPVPTADMLDNISYASGPCFGACPVYRITVNRDGTGIFEGRQFTSVVGERRFMISPAQFRAFEAHLAPLQPDHGAVRFAGEACQQQVSDLPSAEVVWRSGGGERELYLDFGCDIERNRALASRLRAAPDMLPIRDFIGRGD